MLRPVDDRERRRLFTAAALLCTGASILMPLAGRSALELPQERVSFAMHVSIPAAATENAAAAIAAPARDPFLPDPEPSASPDPQSAVAVIRAIVVGNGEPFALVEENGKVRVAGLGDPLGGSRITAIDTQGVRLASGAIFTMQEAGP